MHLLPVHKTGYFCFGLCWSLCTGDQMAGPSDRTLAAGDQIAETSDHAVDASDSTLSRPTPQLPDDLLLHCIARLRRSFHPDLALVSPSWRPLLRSPLLFSLRSNLGATEPSLCINLRTPTDQSRWYLLIRGHHRRPGRFLPLPPLPTPTLGSACAALGPSLFVLGGSRGGIPCSAVQIFDARNNRWTAAPGMRSAREFAAAGALGGRIYVVGGCLPWSDSWAEALDPDSGVWAPVPSPPHLRKKWMHGSAVLGGRLLAVAGGGKVVFDPAAEPAWGEVPLALDCGWRVPAAVVDGILYSYDRSGRITGYDQSADKWKPVEGVEKELPKFLFGSKMTNLGGFLCLVWEGKGGGGSKGMEIECAGIQVVRTGCGGFRGSIAWRELATVATPRGSAMAHCVALEF